MPAVEGVAALMAAELARAVGRSGVVCLGCPLTAQGREEPLLAVCAPPFEALPLATGGLLLAAYSATSRSLASAAWCAANGVAEVWLFDSNRGWVESLSLPSAGSYRKRNLVLPGESTELAALPGIWVTPLPKWWRNF